VKDEEGARSVGQYLASQRKLRRISLEELSERTRIPRRNLERLESGAFDAAADGFARGFVRTVAEALGLDANEAVMRLSDEPRADEVRYIRKSPVITELGVLVFPQTIVATAKNGCLLGDELDQRAERAWPDRDSILMPIRLGDHLPQALGEIGDEPVSRLYARHASTPLTVTDPVSKSK
jgi:transcriptional regulator with XRE-family HTH domain